MNIDESCTAIVVGGASGMGEASARMMRERRASVAILDRDVVRGQAIAREIGAVFVAADVTEEKSVVRAFGQAREQIGQERILIHTAGGGELCQTAWRSAAGVNRHSFELFEKIVRINLSGTFLSASLSAAGMMTLPSEPGGERGVIVLTSSTTSLDSPSGSVAYGAAKAGINSMALTMARDLAPEGIRVNTIVPGSFDTPILAPVPTEFRKKMLEWALHPKRFGDASEFASLAFELIQNKFLNAVTVRIDGGARLG